MFEIRYIFNNAKFCPFEQEQFLEAIGLSKNAFVFIKDTFPKSIRIGIGSLYGKDFGGFTYNNSRCRGSSIMVANHGCTAFNSPYVT